ncbi:MAG: response regulator [Deltaproteobacteria bacterium]|nr:response regulator [Deltaproteobacteria bacterium]
MEAMDGVLLLVDSDHSALTDLKKHLQAHLGLETLTATSAEEALQITKQFPVRVVVVALDLIDDKGYNLVPRLKEMRSGLNAIITTSDYSEQAEKRSRACGLSLYLPKPLDLEILKLAVKLAWRNAINRSLSTEAV